ncbi:MULTISPECIES: MFS transporter [Brevibacterium]|uniref:MFS transporter n=1 Tax=Brevibacterium TaxID=1696 RepID=UPI0015F07536|nr:MULTISPECIES: MFS transporter [Brevibacterium]
MTSSDAIDEQPRLWPTLLPLLTAILAGALGVSMINTALPRIAVDLGLADSTRAWVVDAYPLTTAVTIVVAARLGDRLGRRRILLVGTLGYALFAGLAALSAHALLLIVARALMGASSALIIAAVVGTIGTLFSGRSLILANGLWVAVYGLGSSLGPVLGGVLTEVWGWQGVFLACLPVAVAAAVLTVACLVETSSPGTHSLDALSVITSAIAIGAIVYGIKRVPVSWIESPFWLLGGGLVLALFVARQRRLRDPLLAVDLFARASFSAAGVQILIAAATSLACVYLLSIHLQDHFGRTPGEAGLALTPHAVATILGGLAAPTAAARLGKARTICAGLLVQSAGLGWLGLAPEAGLVPLILVGFGFGIIGALSTTALFEAAPRSRAGQVGAIQEVFFALGGGCGVAIFATIALLDPPLGFTVSLLIAAVLTAATGPLAFLTGRGPGHRRTVTQ